MVIGNGLTLSSGKFASLILLLVFTPILHGSNASDASKISDVFNDTPNADELDAATILSLTKTIASIKNACSKKNFPVDNFSNLRICIHQATESSVEDDAYSTSGEAFPYFMNHDTEPAQKLRPNTERAAARLADFLNAVTDEAFVGLQEDADQQIAAAASATVDYSAKLAICKTANSDAEECCESPLSCAFGIKQLENASPMLVDQLLQTAGYAATAGDLKKTCQVSKNLNVVMGVMNTYIYGKCMSRVNDCREECDQGYDEAELYLTKNNCTSILSNENNKPLQAYTDCQAAKTYKEEFAKERGECRDQFKEEAGKYVMQAVVNLKNYLEAQSCEKQIDAFELPQVAAGPDCTDPANASNPICTPDCSAPGAAQNNILCRGFSSVGSGSMTSLSSSPRTDGGGNSRANLGLTGEGGQEIPFADITPTDAKSKGIGPGGGSGLPGAPGGGGGDSPFAASSAGSGADSGYNTNIGNPTSRAGYRAVSAGAPSSEGGYSAPAGRVAGQGDSGPINLRSLQNKNRSIAGLGSPRALKDISKAHEDIFNKITNAMFRQCETNTYEDCTSNVRVNSKPGG